MRKHYGQKNGDKSPQSNFDKLSNYCCTDRFFDPDSGIAMAASCVKIITYYHFMTRNM